MSNGRAIRMEFETLRSVAAATVPASYALPGSALGSPMANPIVQFKVDNLTDADLFFSIDGVNNHFMVPAGSFWLSDISSNQITEEGLYIAKGTTFYVKQLEVPTTKAVYLSVIYGDTGF